MKYLIISVDPIRGYICVFPTVSVVCTPTVLLKYCGGTHTIFVINTFRSQIFESELMLHYSILIIIDRIVN
jgi:hypothetical protein